MTTTLRETMYDLAVAHEALEAIIAEQEGEITPSQEQAFDAINDRFETKVENAALIAIERRADAEKIRAEAKRLTDRAKALETDADRLVALIANRMIAFGKDKVRGLLVTVGFQKNPPSVSPVGTIDDCDLRNIAMYAPTLVRHEESWSLDKRAVLDAHKAGTLPSDVARRVAITQSTSLRIR